MNLTINYNSKRVKIDNIKKLSEFGKAMGLMFHCRKGCPAMLFQFNKPTRMRIHSLFVFFNFLAIWLDEENKIIEKKIVKPFRIAIGPKKPFYKLVEIPLNTEYKKEIKLLFKNM